MLIFPAIDLKDGQVVRLKRGDFSTVHRVAESPLETAERFYAAGARYLHMVDLDGAREGVRKNSGALREIAATGLRLELGGGLRSLRDIEEVFSLGVWRVVLGTAAVENPALVETVVARYGAERIAVGIDERNGRVRTAGWVEDKGLDALAFAQSMERLGVKHLIYTDIDTDGLLNGPSYGRLKALQDAVGCAVTASGGVSCNEDLTRLRDMGLYAAIVGKAWYAGRVDLSRAVREGGPQL